MMERIIQKIVRKIIVWYFKHFEFLAWSIEVDETTTIVLLRDKYYADRRQYGTRTEYFTR